MMKAKKNEKSSQLADLTAADMTDSNDDGLDDGRIVDMGLPVTHAAMPGEELKPFRRRWYHHPRIAELHLKADWWTLWIGLVSFGIAVALVFGMVPLVFEDFVFDDNSRSLKYVVPQPMSWKSNPFDAWDFYNVIGVPCLLLTFLGLYLLSLYAMGKLKTTKQKVRFLSVTKEVTWSEDYSNNSEADEDDEDTRAVLSYFKLKEYVAGFFFMAFLATLAFWIGRNEWCSKHGLGYAVFSIIIGMMVGNIAPVFLAEPESMDWILKRAAKDGEYFIKCSLVLLAVELTVLVRVGGPAMIVTWIGSPLAIILGFLIGTYVFKCQDSLSMLITVGACWCGASAISAVAPAVLANPEDVALSISVVAFFTIIFTFAQPYFAIAVGMPDDVAGAWIGGSVDQTGNVLVSAAIMSDEAAEVAGIVKMVLNAGLGIMASVVACYWGSYRVPAIDDEDDDVFKDGKGATQKRPPKFTPIMLWDKFPKFTLGFVITSALLTGILKKIEGTPEAEALPGAVSTLNKWWFAIAFVGIGLTTNVKTLFRKAWASGIIQVYLVANTLDILLSLAFSYLAYSYLEN